jgi:hypothetical protein
VPAQTHQRIVLLIAFSSEVGTGSREENASKKSAFFWFGSSGQQFQAEQSSAHKQKGRRKAGPRFARGK